MTENNGDLISREALKEAIKAQQVIDREINPNIVTISYHNLNNIVDNIPTVCGNNPKWCESCVSKGKCTSTRQRGEWKHIIDEYNDVECPFCGFQEDGIYSNYCPKCGADLRWYIQARKDSKRPGGKEE